MSLFEYKNKDKSGRTILSNNGQNFPQINDRH